MYKAIQELQQLESLAAQDTAIHRLPAALKLGVTIAFIIAAAALGRYSFYVLTPFVLYPCILMALAELPYRVLLKRLALALPFAGFGAISALVFDPHGVLVALTILLKTYLCVMAALILVATTRFTEISRTLRKLHVPKIFVVTLELTYRYLSVLLEEAHSMRTAYQLRGKTKARGIEMKHMGSFLGQLVLRSFDRAERVYAAMKCRGY